MAILEECDIPTHKYVLHNTLTLLQCACVEQYYLSCRTVIVITMAVVMFLMMRIGCCLKVFSVFIVFNIASRRFDTLHIGR